MLNGALSLGLLSTGVVAFPVGTWIDHTRRGVMTLCSLAGGLLLLAWAQVETPWVFYGIWVFIGASMAGVLYEPAFAVITAVFGPDAARHYGTDAVAGFASTVFMPLTQLLIGTLGWRNALLILGALNLLVPAPARRVCPWNDGSHPPEAPQDDAPPAPELRAILRGRVFVGLAIGLHTMPRRPPLSSSLCRC